MKTKLVLAEGKEGNLRGLPFSRYELTVLFVKFIKFSSVILLMTALLLSSCSSGKNVMHNKSNKHEKNRTYRAGNSGKNVLDKRYKTRESNRTYRAMLKIQFQ